MDERTRIHDDEFLYCKCPYCGLLRAKIKKKFNIVKRGRERNGLARFFCTGCGKWFNEKTGEGMRWMGRG